LSGLLRKARWHATDATEQQDIQGLFGTVPVRIVPNIPTISEATETIEKVPGSLILVYYSLIAEKKNLHFLLTLLVGNGDLADNPKVIAIGECGLDYFHSKPEDISRQKEIFDQHIELANAVKKPLMLHVRNPKSGGSAYKDALEMIKARSKVPFDFHFFAGSLEEALAICDIGGYLSFTGVITFARNYDEVIRSIPIERILSETDCPYVAPVPYRGTRNRPDYVIKVVESLAQIRGIGLEEMSRILLENAERFYGVKF
jgi:TatD family hydrolase